MPVGNRILMERYYNRLHQQHRERLSKMQSTPRRCQTMDNHEPETMSLAHMKVNLKKIQVTKERQEQVDAENNELLERLVRIKARDSRAERCPTGGRHVDPFPYRSAMQVKPGVRLDRHHYPMVDCVDRNLITRSMNSAQRQRQAESVRADNMKMLERLQATKAVYNRAEWKSHENLTNTYLRNCRSAEIAHLSESLRGRALTTPLTSSRQASRAGERRPGTSLPAIQQSQSQSPEEATPEPSNMETEG